MYPSTKIKPNSILISNELIEVKPLDSPSVILYYMDYKYEDLLEVRKKKINKILERIRNNG